MLRRVLAIDDYQISLDLIDTLFREHLPNTEVYQSRSGEEGIALARAKVPDLILLDVKMPGMDGFEVCRRLKQDPATSDIPVLMISSELIGADDRRRGLNQGADAYLCRPFKNDIFIREIKDRFRFKQQEDRLRRLKARARQRLSTLDRDLQRSEEKFRSLFEHSPDAIFVEDAEGHVLDANPAACRLHGLDHAELVGKHVMELVPPESWDHVFLKHPQMLSGDLVCGEGFSLGSDGVKIPVEFRAAPFLYEGQRAVLLHVRDISDREHIRHTLHYGEALKGLITDIATYSICLTSDEVDGGIESALQEIGEFTDVDRGYVFFFPANPEKARCTHEWCAPGIPSIRPDFSGDTRREITWGLHLLKRGEILHVPHLDPRSEAEPEIHAALRERGVKSMINLPLLFRGKVVGMLGFETERCEKSWPEEVVSPLRILGQIFVNALLRRESEDTLRSRESIYQNLVEGLPALSYILRWGSSPHLCYVSPQVKSLLGFTVEECMRTPSLWRRQIDQRDRLRILDELSRLSRSRKSIVLEFRMRARVGKVVWFRTVCSPVRDARGALTTLDGVMFDITQEKLAQEALLESEHKYRVLFDYNPSMCFVLDGAGTVLSVNRVVEEHLGYAEAELAGQSVLRVFHPDDREQVRACLHRRLERPHEPALWEFRKITKDGRTIVVREYTRVIESASGEPQVLVACEDITEAKETAASLRESEEQLRQSQKMEALGRLAGGIAHDFNNLLTSILGFGNMALDRTGIDAGLRGEIGQIVKAGHRAAKLTRQLLTVSRRQVMRVRPLDLNGIVRDMAEMLHRTVGEDVELVTTLTPGLGHVVADEGQIEQVILNLVVNARDAMPLGGQLTISTFVKKVGIEKSRQVTSLKPGHFIVLSIRDTGSGMTEEVKLHAIEPFFTTKEEGKGTGLGLSMVYGIVTQVGGTVEITSHLNRGTEIILYFPRMMESGPSDVDFSDPSAPRGHETVLVVEDEEGVRNLTQQMLTAQGYTVLGAQDGQEALSICRATKAVIDLVVTDVVMPHMSGPSLVEEIRRSRPDICVLFISGFSDEAITLHGVNLKDTNFLTKPYVLSVLASKVREVLDAE